MVQKQSVTADRAKPLDSETPLSRILPHREIASTARSSKSSACCFVDGLTSVCGVCAIALAGQTVAQAKKKQANQLSSQFACLLN